MASNKIIKYPDLDDENYGSTLYKKREFQTFRYPSRKTLDNYEEVKEYRDKMCNPVSFQLQPHQSLLSNLINTETPYKGLLLFHGTGVGKTCASITIAENFKEQVSKYNMRILVLLSGPTLKQNFNEQLIGRCTAGEYFDPDQIIHDPHYLKKKKSEAFLLTTKYYRIMSYKAFLKKVLGEKIKNKYKKYMKNNKGKFKRNIAVNPITFLANTLIVVDEAHNLTNNNIGKSLQKVLNDPRSVNLKLVLLTATPMNNISSDIVYLINFLRPTNDQMKVNMVFDESGNFRKGGRKYFIDRVRGYVSYLRGDDPMTFPKRVEMGEVPKGLDFTKLTQCKLQKLQLQTYMNFDKKKKTDDTKIDIELSKKYEGIANIVFPGLGKDKTITGYYGNDGIKQVKKDIDYYQNDLIDAFRKYYKDDTIDSSFIYMGANNDTVSGRFLNEKYLKDFSTKFYSTLMNLNNNIAGKNGVGTSFIYSNLLGVGIKVFEEVLNQNGYVKYGLDWRTNVSARCYYCGNMQSNHSKQKHDFLPSTYVSITGEKDEEDDTEAERLRKIFVSEGNIDGKHIKVLLGSSVFSEGANLQNVKDVHILEGYYNLTRIDQIIGRAIRHCSHYKQMTEENPYPEVKVYKYVISLGGDVLTKEENLYRLAEDKYKKIKKVERILKEISVDCPFNINKNIYPEEALKYKDCGQKGKPKCPQSCDFMECEYKCNDDVLNRNYYDSKSGKYRELRLDELDNSTFNIKLLKFEKQFIKEKIKEMFKRDIVYTLSDILNYVSSRYPDIRKRFFEKRFVYIALNEMIPITDNDFNNLKDVVKDKFDRNGYIIYRNKYYIFQPFDKETFIKLRDRLKFDELPVPKISLNKYLIAKKIDVSDTSDSKIIKYDYENTIKYYSARSEYDIVGIISEGFAGNDVFNIRGRRKKDMKKKRAKGFATSKGANCLSKSTDELREIAKKLGLTTKKTDMKSEICEKIKNKLLELERNSVGDKKMTYIKIPANHPTYRFPYNLEDRRIYIKSKINNYFKLIGTSIVLKDEKDKLILVDQEYNRDFLEKLGGKLENGRWIFHIS
jgi:superfamily II DNA or RNA helicase